MEAIISPAELSNAVILFFVTGAIFYGILRETKPAYIMETQKKRSQMKLLSYAALFSLLFTIGTVIVSVQVDKQYSRKGKSIKVSSL